MKFLFFSITVALSFSATISVFSSDIPVPHRPLSESQRLLIDEYKKAFPSIKDFYGNCRLKIISSADDMIIKHAETAKIDLPKIKSIESTVYSRGDDYFRWDRSVVISPEGGKGRVFLDVFLQNKDDVYLFTKSETEGEYSLRAKLTREEGRMVFDSIRDVLMSPYSVLHNTLDTLLYDYPDDITDRFVLEVAEEGEGDAQTVFVSGSYVLFNTKVGSSATLLPSKKWVVSQATTGSFIHENGTMKHVPCKVSVTYSNEVDSATGFPFLKSYEQVDAAPDTKSKITHEVKEFVPGAPPLSVFDPKQFLPEREHYKLAPRKMSWQRKTALVGGFALIALGLGIRFFNARKHPRTPV